jgi:hypothetical protein
VNPGRTYLEIYEIYLLMPIQHISDYAKLWVRDPLHRTEGRDMGGGMEDVTVKVPGARIGEFYEMYGRWLKGEEPEVVDESGGKLQPWDVKNDLALAARAWSEFPERAKLLFGTLMDEPGEKFTGTQLAEMHNIPNGKYGTAGVLAHPGRQVRKLGRHLPSAFEPNPDGGSFYWMEAEVADLFRRVRGGADKRRPSSR